jgi:uncharacterized protein
VTDDRDSIVRYWLRRGREAIEEAEMMAQAGHWNSCASRLYYACFYAATAVLFQHGLSSSKHSGVLSLFNRRFTKTGVIPHDLAAVYNRLFASRQRADYRALVDFQERDVRPWLPQVRSFVLRIEELVSPPATDQPNA